LSWNIDTSANAWTAWSSAPAMSDTESLSQKKISALSAGVPGNYVFTITVNDNKGESNSSAERDFTINVINPPPVITANDITCTASTTNPLNYYGVTAQDYISNYPLAYGLSVSVPNNLTANFARSPGSDFYTFSLTGIFNPITESPIYPSKDYNFTITVTDVFGVSAIEDFKITVLNNRPVIHTPLNCDTVTRVNNLYDSCAVTAIDADGNAITYSFSGLPAGISGDSATGVISGTPAQTGDYTIVITVTDEYGAVSNQGIYDLKVNNYCGDGTVQSPNMENFFEECEAGETLDCVTSDNYDGRLSCIVDECIWDDICNPTESCGDGSVNGDEECDNADGTADNPADSYENNQYSCTTPPADTCEYTGGWCGDGIIQDGYGEECDPNETKIDYESRMGIVIDNATWIAVQAACNYCAMSCLDADGDGYGYPVNLNCLHFELDCDDRPNGEDGIPGTFDDGANINPGQPDDCTQYDGIDNNCDGKIDDSDHDNDEDGIGACSDNCPDIFNPEQEDADGDEIGDFCDDCYNYGGSCVELTITQGVWTKTFRPYVKADTSSEFYCYNGNCANPYTTYPTSSNLAEAYDFVESQRSNIFAYINANNNMLSLGFLHDYINDGSGGEVHFNFSGNGWDMSIVSVSDDNTNEFSKIIHGNWDWEECCTDGGMIDIANLNTSWSITITPDFISGINSWAMKAPGNEENIPNLTDPVIINYIAP
ncbi:putative Ig domain-containing protein, partial [Candidatus Parcubacteria bacterium]|nr:putative Ig domain-containing protein [Candidatus Parcubacteria bacterium]